MLRRQEHWLRGVYYAYWQVIENHAPSKGGAIRTFTVSLLGAIVLAAGLVMIRNHRVEEEEKGKEIPPGETVRSEISLDRLREIGL